jgi:ABC-type transport system involved in cytochrome bd biosynthesis fused ATPase/permease subunit
MPEPGGAPTPPRTQAARPRPRRRPREGSPRGPFDTRLARFPSVRSSVAGSVVLGLVSTAGVVAQAVGLAHLLAGAMPGARPGDRSHWFFLLGAGFAARALTALAGEVVAAFGASAAKAELRSRLLAAVLSGGQASGGQASPDPSAMDRTAGVPDPGEVATIAGPGLDALDVYIGRCLPDLILAVAAPLTLLVAVGALDWVSVIVMATVLALFPVFGALVGQASWALGAERWRRVEQLGDYIADVFRGMPVLRAFGRSGAQRERIVELSRALGQSTTKALRLAFLSALVLDTLGSLSVALVAVPLGLRLISGSISLAPALAVLAVAPEVFAPLRKASAEFHESTEGLAAMARVLAVTGEELAPTRWRDARPAGGARQAGRVARGAGTGVPVGQTARKTWQCGSGNRASLRDMPVYAQKTEQRDLSPSTSLTFRYTEPPSVPGVAFPDLRLVPIALRSVSVRLKGRPEPVLDGAELSIRPGEIVALTGPSGSGKSTIVSLLAGFLAPAEGKVLVGDTDLQDLDLRWWRSQVTYLPEHPTLLSTTLAENLRLADQSATDEQLLSALEQAGAPELASSLPSGLGTPLGDGGQSLSAGELQRVALARVILRPALLYLLDEPTVHLDVTSEEAALAGLRRAIGDASALIVSHSPPAARAADRVVTVRDAKIVELSPLEPVSVGAVPA